MLRIPSVNIANVCKDTILCQLFLKLLFILIYATFCIFYRSSKGSLSFPLDLLPDSKTSRVIYADPQENALKSESPAAPEPSPRYNIDLTAMQKNVEKLAMADQLKNQALTPRDLYEKACPGLLSIPSDVTDPRQWYSSMSSKSMIKKSPRDEKVKKKSQSNKAKESSRNAKEEGPGTVAFLVTFPNITKTEGVRHDKGHTRQRSDSESSDKLPPLSHPQSASTDISLSNIQTQVHIRNLVPNIDDSPYHSARRNRDAAFSDRSSVDSSENIKYVTKKAKARRGHQKIQVEEEGPKVAQQRDIDTPPSALDRELTKSMEDILKSVTTCGPEAVARSLRQPTNISLQLPSIEKDTPNVKLVPEDSTEASADMSRTTSVNWQTGLGLRRTYSYKNLNEYSQPMYPYSEHEMSTRLVKVSSNENLAQSSAKFKQLRIPEKRATVDKLKSFRNTYSLRQKSMLKLKMKSGSDVNRVPMNKVQLERSNTMDEYGNVSSKIAPYIEGKLPRFFVIVPDSHGEIKPLEVMRESKAELYVPGKEPPEYQSTTEDLQLPGTSFSHIPNDDSSEKNTLISKSGDATSRKSLKDFEFTEKGRRQSRSRSKSKNRSKSRSRSRNSNDRNEKKRRIGTLSRGSNVSRSHSQGDSPAAGHMTHRSKSRDREDRSKSRERQNKKGLSEDNQRPQPSARSPSSKTVHIKPKHEHQESLIPPPSRKNFSRPYIPPKLKRHKTKYTDSLDSFIHQHGKGTRASLVSLAVAEKKSHKYRKKQLVRAIDKYLLTKLGDKLFSSQEDISEVTKNAESKEKQHIQLVENGKRPVFRKMKGMVPFDERGRPITRGKDEPVVMEKFPSQVYKPSLRPPSFKLDLKQYPPGKPGPLDREYSYDKKTNTVIPSGIERSLTIGELIFQSPDKMSHTPNDGQISEISSSMSHLHVAPPKTKHSKKSHSTSKTGRIRNHKPGAGYVELRVLQKHTSDVGSFDATSINDSEVSRLQTMTPADSITASMMKEIYENLEDYLDEKSPGYVENMKQRELVLEG